MSDSSTVVTDSAPSELSTKLLAGTVIGLGGGLVGLFKDFNPAIKHLFLAGCGVVLFGSALR